MTRQIQNMDKQVVLYIIIDYRINKTKFIIDAIFIIHFEFIYLNWEIAKFLIPI